MKSMSEFSIKHENCIYLLPKSKVGQVYSVVDMSTCYILFALASVASAAHFGIISSSVSIPIDTKARYRHEITSPVHHHTIKTNTLINQIIPRGGDGLIEENPEYESDDVNDYDNSDSEEESEVYDDESSDDEEETTSTTKTFLSKKLKMYNHSKSNKSTPTNLFGITLPDKLGDFIGERITDLAVLVTILVCHDGIPIVCKLSKMEIIAAFVIIEVGLLIFHYYQDNNNKKKIKNNTNSTQTTEEEHHQLRIPIVPILSLLLILGLQYIIPKSTQFFILPIILRALSGDLDPDSTLGKLLLPIFGNLINMNNNDDEDLITKMSYVPPLEQHYSFEQVNEKYIRDYGAYKKAWGVNPLVARASTSCSSSSVSGRGMSSSRVNGGGMAASLSSLFMNTKPSPTPTTTIPKSSTSPKLNYPTQYNNGTVIILDMTKLDTQATKMENIRDQISFLIQLVDSLKEGEEKEKVKVLASTIVDAIHVVGDEEEQLKLQRSMDMLNVTANVTTSLASSSETNSTSTVTTFEVKDDQPTTPIVEVVVLLESPGGGVSQYGLAASHLQRLRSNPNIMLTICVDTVAASGGYMMACMSSPGQLYCAPFAMIGSIGVIGQSINVQKTLESYGIKPYVFRGGKSKNPVGLVGDVTKEGVQHMQGMIDRIHDAFRDHVAGAREEAFAEALLSDDCGIPRPTINYFHPNLGRVDQMAANGVSMAHVMDQVASGDVYLGVQAIKMGLVDRLITSDEYISERIRHGARVLKLINYHRAGGLSDLFSAPNPRHRMMNRSNGMVNILKKIVVRMTSAVLTWAEEDGMGSSSMPSFSAGGIDDLQIH